MTSKIRPDGLGSKYDCRKIRERMARGAAHSQREVDALFGRNRNVATEGPSVP